MDAKTNLQVIEELFLEKNVLYKCAIAQKLHLFLLAKSNEC